MSKKARLDASDTSTNSRTQTTNTRRPTTTGTSATNPVFQEIIVAVSESRGIAPIAGLAILNISLAEAVLCQICDTQTYVRTLHKLSVFAPTEVLFANTARGSKLLGAVEENLVKNGDQDLLITCIDRKYWNENSGFDFVRQLALSEDIEALKVSLSGKFFAASCFAAASTPLDSLEYMSVAVAGYPNADAVG